jgi:hypothetical protein
VFYSLNTDMPTIGVVLTGAAAAVGRYLPASTFRLFGSRLSKRSRKNPEAAREIIEPSKDKTILALGVFVISPLPSG